MTIAAPLALTLMLLAPQLRPNSEQTAERVDWWPKIDTIESMLAKQKWRAARKQAERIARIIESDAWSATDLHSVLAELALQQAVAETNLGLNRAALWHWYAALNLDDDIAGRDLTDYGQAAALLSHDRRHIEQLPADFDRLSDLELLDLQPPTFPQVEPPDIVTNAAAVVDRQPNILIEAILDEAGMLHQPILVTENAHPILVYVAFEWLSEMPPASPARLQGRAVDSLQLFDISFEIERTGGQIFMEPPDN